MTESSSPEDHPPATEEAGLTEFIDWINSEHKLDAGQEVEDGTFESLTESKPTPKARGKRKGRNNSATTKRSNNEPTRKSKRLKTLKDSQNDTAASEIEPEQPSDPQAPTEDESVASISCIKEEEEGDEILQMQVELNPDQMASFSTLPDGATLESQPNSPLEAKPPVDGVICPYCHIEYVSEKTLKRHITNYHTAIAAEIERESKTCPECRGSFTSVGTLHRHLTTWHNQIKQFVCRHCEASFGEEVYLRRHLAERHTGDNPLGCVPCGLLFASKSETQDHLRSAVHVRPPFKCDHCGEITPSRAALRNPCGSHIVPLAGAPGNSEETLKQLRSSAGPSLDSLAKKLGITPKSTEQGLE